MYRDQKTINVRHMTSPFASVLATHQNTLPHVFQEQFLLSVDAPYHIVLEGHMDEVWQRPRWMKPLFWILSWFDMLFPEVGHHVPATMIISGSRDTQQYPCHRWDRTFTFASLRRFDAVMTINPRAQRVVEQMGPWGSLEMEWEVTFQPPDTMHIFTTGCNLRMGRRRLPLPSWGYPTVRAVETALPDEPLRIHIDLTVSHHWLGNIFGYYGVFMMRRQTNQE